VREVKAGNDTRSQVVRELYTMESAVTAPHKEKLWEVEETTYGQ
jgi:hypothetical protein